MKHRRIHSNITFSQNSSLNCSLIFFIILCGLKLISLSSTFSVCFDTDSQCRQCKLHYVLFCKVGYLPCAGTDCAVYLCNLSHTADEALSRDHYHSWQSHRGQKDTKMFPFMSGLLCLTLSRHIYIRFSHVALKEVKELTRTWKQLKVDFSLDYLLKHI